MAGIQEAKRMVERKENRGIVLAMGEFDNAIKTKYMLILINKGLDSEHISTQLDYGSDLRFENGISIGNEVELLILDNYCAAWDKVR